jgi:hypothetical protein
MHERNGDLSPTEKIAYQLAVYFLFADNTLTTANLMMERYYEPREWLTMTRCPQNPMR